MSTGIRVLDLTDFDGGVRSARGAVMIAEKRIPLDEVAVILLGMRATISGGAFALLAKYDVVLASVDWRGVPNYLCYPFSENSRVGARHIAQSELSLPRKKQAWKQIVRAKIAGQCAVLEASGMPGSRRLALLRDGVRSGDSTHVEGQAAKVYWDGLFRELDFRRVPGSSEKTNAMLNYGYTVLRGFVIRAIVEAGLWPSLGVWHRNRSNAYCLADDLIEPFRPIVDAVVWRYCWSDGLRDAAVKASLVKAIQSPMDASEKLATSRVKEFCQSFALYCEGKQQTLAPPQWDLGNITSG